MRVWFRVAYCAGIGLMLFSVNALAQPFTFQPSAPARVTTISRPTIQMGGAMQTTASPQNKVVTTLASKDRGAALDAPQGITTDGVNLYVTDPINNTISRVSIATGTVTRFAGSPATQAWGYDDGPSNVANFKRPQGITTDGKNLYVADTFNHVIRKIVISTGAVSTLCGRWNTAGAVGAEDGSARDASFNAPRGITTDGTNLYVTDTGNHIVRKIVIATGMVSTLAGTAGVIGSADGVGAAASFDSLTGITTDGSSVFVADARNNTIRRISIATGIVTTLAGQAGTSGSEDGIGRSARFTGPYGVVTDGTHVFVTDSFNHTIRRIVIATGVVTTLAGVPGVSGKADRLGHSATFSKPGGITNDGIYLYVSDSLNGAIRVLE